MRNTDRDLPTSVKRPAMIKDPRFFVDGPLRIDLSEVVFIHGQAIRFRSGTQQMLPFVPSKRLLEAFDRYHGIAAPNCPETPEGSEERAAPGSESPSPCPLPQGGEGADPLPIADCPLPSDSASSAVSAVNPSDGGGR